MYKAVIVADSAYEYKGKLHRITSFELTMPRFLLAEFNTHRSLSRNCASTRAIPAAKRIQAVRDNCFVPLFWGKNQPGMAAAESLPDNVISEVEAVWRETAEFVCKQTERLIELGLHKQTAGRMIEPWTWVTDIATATDVANMFNLRISEHAQPEYDYLMLLAAKAYKKSQPKILQPGEWHLPYISFSEMIYDLETLLKMSAARCAKISYERQYDNTEVGRLCELHDGLKANGHMSPLEHQACVPSLGCDCESYSGNFFGWLQYRKLIPNENRSVMNLDQLIEASEARWASRGVSTGLP